MRPRETRSRRGCPPRSRDAPEKATTYRALPSPFSALSPRARERRAHACGQARSSRRSAERPPTTRAPSQSARDLGRPTRRARAPRRRARARAADPPRRRSGSTAPAGRAPARAGSEHGAGAELRLRLRLRLRHARGHARYAEAEPREREQIPATDEEQRDEERRASGGTTHGRERDEIRLPWRETSSSVPALATRSASRRRTDGHSAVMALALSSTALARRGEPDPRGRELELLRLGRRDARARDATQDERRAQWTLSPASRRRRRRRGRRPRRLELGGDADGVGVDAGLVEHDVDVCAHGVPEERDAGRRAWLGLDLGDSASADRLAPFSRPRSGDEAGRRAARRRRPRRARRPRARRRTIRLR